MVEHYCKTEKAIIVPALIGDRGIFRVPFGQKEFPGFIIDVKALQPIVPQLIEELQEQLGKFVPGDYRFFSEFQFQISIKGEALNCYFMQFLKPISATNVETHSLIEHLKMQPKGRNRVVLFQFLQLLAGVDQQEIYLKE